MARANLLPTRPEGRRTRVLNLTLLDLVSAVSEYARSDTEVIATVVFLVNSGRVRLCGAFKGARFDLPSRRLAAA